MPANVETMFYVREAPWHGLGNRVEHALSSEEALQEAGLNWRVIQKPIQTADHLDIAGYKANIRESDNRVLGVVTDRYKIVQNYEAFAFTDDLLGEGVRYETAGSLQNGKKVWLLAKLPENYIISGDRISPYLVFSNSHDGSGSIKVAMTPIRVVCQNTLFKDFIHEWIKLYQPSVKISTVRVRNHESGKLLEYFEGCQVKQISKKMYQDALINLFDKGFAINTIAGIHSTGKMIFAKAVELEIIKNDPTQYAKLPRPQKTVEEIEREEHAVKYLEKEELARFLRTAKEQGLERDYVIFLTLAYSGLRVGELCALKWKDLSTNDHTVSITKTYYNPKNRATEYQLLTPKTSTSRRTIELDPVVFKELDKLKARQNELKMLHRYIYHDDDFIFAKTGKDMGYPEFIKTIQNRMRRLLRLAGLNGTFSPHSLRHTHTSLLAEAGVGIHEIMERLGHQDDEITKRVYLHVTKTMKKEASLKFGELMRSL